MFEPKFHAVQQAFGTYPFIENLGIEGDIIERSRFRGGFPKHNLRVSQIKIEAEHGSQQIRTGGRIIARPRLGGLHRRYEWLQAA